MSADHHHDHHEAHSPETPADEADSRTDVKAIAVIFAVTVAFFLLIASGFDGALGVLGLA